MSFLLERFKGIDLKDPIDSNHGLDLKSMATAFAEQHKAGKSQSTEESLSAPRALPGVHHPVFRGKPANYDPREQFIAEFMAKRGDYNVFRA
jgi:citrate synthase